MQNVLEQGPDFGVGAKYLILNRHGKAHWSLEPASSTACVSVSKSKLMEWTEYLIDNIIEPVDSISRDE